MDFTPVKEAIKSISESCIETAKEMSDVLDRAIGVSCRADASAKDDLFKEIEETLSAAREACPEKEKEIQFLDDFYNQSVGVKCSGG